MPTNSLLIDLAGIARLAGVKRPVASMWKKRFASAADPFPPAVTEKSGRPVFDAARVAEWLTRTDHGNNPTARADAAAAASPDDFSFSDRAAVDELEALIVLQHQLGTLEGLTRTALRDAASDVDPEDEFLRSEISAHINRGAGWMDYTERLIDASYSASAAMTLVSRRQTPLQSAAGSAGRISSDAIALVVAATVALVGDSESVVTLDARDPDLSAAVANALDDATTLRLPIGLDARRVRRRLATDGHWVAESSASSASRSLIVARVPRDGDQSAAETLSAVDNISLTLTDRDAAVVIGPARVLIDALAASEERLRSDVLRTGRVRGIARLTTGLVDSAPREALGLWVLGAPTGEVAIADRFTVVADLTDVPLTPATRADLVSDVVASMGSARDVRGHSFRFARFARTGSLLARGGSLVASAPSKHQRPGQKSDIPALLDSAAEAVAPDLAPISISPVGSAAPAAASVDELIREGHLRMISGTRLDAGLTGSGGLVVVTAPDLEDHRRIGSNRVDQLAFARQHPSAPLTRPGDLIFRTSPSAAAWVDVEGSKVVAYPARVLRITAGDPGGLVPEIMKADISGAASGPGAWRRWILRRVAPPAIAPLRAALADIDSARSNLEARTARLTDYADLLVAGATSGAITLNDSTIAADAASTQ